MKQTARKILGQGLFFTIAFLVGNILNLIFNFYLGRTLSSPDFALVALFMSILYAINVFFNALSITASHSIGISSINAREEVVSRIFTVWGKGALATGIIVSFVWILLLPLLSILWKVESVTLIFFLPIFIFGTLAFINRGILQGTLRFTDSGIIFLTESGTKLFIAFTFVGVGLSGWAYLAIPISIIIAFLVSVRFARRLFAKKHNLSNNKQFIDKLFPRRFFLFSFLLGLSTLTFLSIDVILVKTFFSVENAGAYALITLGGKMLFLFSSLLGAMFISVVSNAVGEKKNTKNIFWVFFGTSLVIVSVGTIFFLIFGERFFLFFFGQKVLVALSILPIYIIAIAAFSLSHVIVLYHHARRKFIFPIISSISSVFLIIGTSLFHATLEQFVWTLFAVAIIDIVTVSIFHFYNGHISAQRVDNEDEFQISPPMSEKIFKNGKLPTVTIGIPAYNEQYNIGNILKQILQQKQEGFVIEKIIVASDGSTDNTVEVANKFVGNGIFVIAGEENRGQNYRQNEIISNTLSDILVLLNADIQLGNNEVVYSLVSPLLKGADLSAQWAKPLKPHTFLERILCAGFDLKYFIYNRYKDGDNIYTCVGHMRALSRRLYSNIIFPADSGGEDQFLYLACIAGGYRYKHSSDAKAFFRLPSVWGDYVKYARRIFQTQRKHENIFSDEIIQDEMYLPVSLKIKGCIYAIIRHPFNTLLYIVIHIRMQRWSMKQPIISKAAFEVSLSTKRLSSFE